nr:transmembrane protein 186-like isoform X2 [Lepeophtheirus salmonis]
MQLMYSLLRSRRYLNGSRLTLLLPRKASSATAAEPVPCNNDFKLIYRNPFIPLARFSVRFKIYQTGLTLLLVPPYWYGALTGSIHPENALAVTSISFAAICLVFGFGEYFRRIIGMVYIDQKDFSSVKISHLSLMGHRNNFIIPLEEIMPISESGADVSKILWNVHFYHKDYRKMFISTQKGGIVDKEQFEIVFGKDSKL